LQAWDPLNQRLKWNIEGGGGIGGGTTTTAGNLVFQTINDGRFRAIRADNGEILYEVKTGRTGMGPPITYEVDGKQHVAFGGGLGRAATRRAERREGGLPPNPLRVRTRRKRRDAGVPGCGPRTGNSGTVSNF
jgi:hypothetical protein